MRFMEHLPCFSPAFVVVLALADHICRNFLRHLLSFWLVLETFAGNMHGVCCRATFDAYVPRSAIMELCCCIFI